MRQRKIKNEEEKIEALSEFIVKMPRKEKGHWQQCFTERGIERRSAEGKIFLEIGCGKGQFITGMAQAHPDRNYVAVEGASSVVLRALEKAREKELLNLLFITEYINDLTDYFSPGELEGIYLNFSDPWPKERHAKRRLTHRSYLESYKKLLSPGSFIELKTDNDGLFTFSLSEFRQCGMEIVECTDDLHNSEFAEKNISTEYEDKFKKLWKKIHYCKVKILTT